MADDAQYEFNKRQVEINELQLQFNRTQATMNLAFIAWLMVLTIAFGVILYRGSL